MMNEIEWQSFCDGDGTNTEEIEEALKEEYNPEECYNYFLKKNPIIRKIIDE